MCVYILYLSPKKYVLNNSVFFTWTFKKETFNNDTCKYVTLLFQFQIFMPNFLNILLLKGTKIKVPNCIQFPFLCQNFEMYFYIDFISQKIYANNFVFFTQTFKKETIYIDTCNVSFPIPYYYASTTHVTYPSVCLP